MNILEELKNTFINAAILHGEATETGDYKLGNKQYAVIANAYRKLKDQKNGIEILHKLMNHKNISVQSWAASYLLKTHTEEAKKVLQSVADKHGLVGFSAKMTLQEWEKGNLKFD